MSGRSVRLDPRIHAVRADLADIRLADRVFAPHYAKPVSRRIASAVTLRAGRPADSEPLAMLAAGDAFELLDVIGDEAWGVAPAQALVGYLPVAALA